jgi:FMN phosphatase YigB (HAD superfamily)
LDIDGVLADYHGHFLRFAVDWLGITPSLKVYRSYTGEEPLHKHLGISKEEYRACKLAFRQGGLKRSMPATEQASWLTRRLMCEVEVWITTTRPYLRLDNIDPDTREWMRRNQINYDHILYDEQKYVRLCSMVDKQRIVAVVDDEAENIDQARDIGLTAVWMRNRYNSRMNPPVAAGVSLQAQYSMRDVYSVLTPLISNWKEKYQ